MEKTKVVYLLSSDQNYGAPKSLIDLILNLKQNHNIYPIVITCTNGNVNQICDKNNIENYCVNYDAFMIVGGSNLFRKIVKRLLFGYFFIKYKIKNYFAIKKIEQIIDFNEIKLIHTNINRIDIGNYLSKKYNIQHIWHIREFGKEDYNCISLRINYIKYMNNNPNNTFIAISEAIKKKWIDLGLYEERVKVIYNGINLDNIESRKENKIDSKIRIIFAGLISENKGQLQLIQAISKMDEKYKKNINVDFYGNGRKPYIAYLKRIITKNDLCQNFRFKGYSNKLNNIYKNYNIGIMCSKKEGFGRVTIEYISAGLYVIASNTGANPEIIKKEFGELYKYGDTKDLINKIENAFGKQVDINFARNYVKENYSSNVYANKIYKTYRKLLGEEEHGGK